MSSENPPPLHQPSPGAAQAGAATEIPAGTTQPTANDDFAHPMPRTGAGPADAIWTHFRSQMPIAKSMAYLDHAAVGPLFGPGGQAIKRFADQAMTLGDTVWPQWNQTLGEVRRQAAIMLDCGNENIATIPNTTTGINCVAEGLDWASGDNVVIAEHEFPSNLFTWLNQQVKGVEVRQVPRRGNAVVIDDLIDACDERTRLISVSWVGYASGYRIDVDQLVERAHRKGVLVFLDAIQGLGMYPLSISQTPVDFVAADGHKWLLGPEGFGILMVQPKHFDRLRGTNVGWASVKDSFNYANPSFQMRDAATRFESGSANMMAAAGLSQSLKYFNSINQEYGVSAIGDRILDSAEELSQRLCGLGARVDRDANRSRQSGIVSFSIDDISPTEIRQRGLDRGVVTSCRGGGVRAAVHAYNNSDDFDRLCDIVRDAKSRDQSSDSPSEVSP